MTWRRVVDQTYYTYILANTFHHLYTGMTNDLQGRVYDHKHPEDLKAFTARYKIDRLVHFERFQYVRDAIAREKQIKSWNRVKKIALIVAHNPTWVDLSLEWGEAIELFDEGKMRRPETF